MQISAFYCPDKLVDDKSKFIPDSSFVLLQDVFVTTVPQPPPEIDNSLLLINDSPFDPLPVSSTSTSLPAPQDLPSTSTAVIDLTAHPDQEIPHPLPLVLKPQFGLCVASPSQQLQLKQTKLTVQLLFPVSGATASTTNMLLHSQSTD